MGEGEDQVVASSASNMDFNKDTFITSLRGNDDDTTINMAATEARQALVASVGGMGRVQDLHLQLSHVVGSLSDKVSEVLKKQETEFLSAYRAHMYNVQKELQELRSKVQNAELELQRDEKIKNLTQERDWFRKEALRLDAYATSMKKEIKFMEEKLDSVDEDRVWLENQLKSAKKQNKLLRTELEMHLGSDAAGQRGSTQLLAIEAGPNQQCELAPPIRNSHSQNHLGRGGGGASSDRGNAHSKSSVAFYNTPSYERSSSQKSLFDEDPVSSASNNHQDGDKALQSSGATKRQLRQLREQLGREREQVRELRAQVIVERTERSDLQDLFSKCVDDVKKDILRRKDRAKRAQSKKANPGPSAVHSEQSLDLQSREARIIQHAQFTALDRRKLLERLLEQDRVFEILQDEMFPQASIEATASRLALEDVPGNNVKSPAGSSGAPSPFSASREVRKSPSGPATAAGAGGDFGLSLLLESM